MDGALPVLSPAYALPAILAETFWEERPFPESREEGRSSLCGSQEETLGPGWKEVERGSGYLDIVSIAEEP